MSPSRRPFPVTITACLVLTVSVINLARLGQAFAKWSFLSDLLPFSPLYLVVTGLLWGVSGLALTWGLWRAKPWARRFTLLAMLAYSLYHWLDRFLLAGYAARNEDWRFWAVVNLLLLAATAWDFSRPKVKGFFGDQNER